MNEVRTADPWDPESSTLHLAPRGFNAGVVDSLGAGFVLAVNAVEYKELAQTRYTF